MQTALTIDGDPLESSKSLRVDSVGDLGEVRSVREGKEKTCLSGSAFSKKRQVMRRDDDLTLCVFLSDTLLSGLKRRSIYPSRTFRLRWATP